MKSFSTYLILFFLLPIIGLQAQNVSCAHRLELFDSAHDGWNGAILAVEVNGETTRYTLTDNGIDDDGAAAAFELILQEGDSITFTFTGGSFDSEITYGFYNATDSLLFFDGPAPTRGVVYAAVVSCPSCPVPPPSGVSLDDVRAVRADISWTPSDPQGLYNIVYGLAGFDPDSTGTVVQRRGSSARLENLQENTVYDLYLSVICSGGDTSAFVGPYTFKTLYKNDVGVVDILSPMTACGLGAGSIVEVVLKNFGGSPQALFEFKFSVNGVTASIPVPNDGYYTGVLGKDSTYIYPFETTANLSAPGEYIIAAWTELEGDSNPRNDTTFITIQNVPIITEYPYFENFEEWAGGWRVGEGSQNPSWEFGHPAYAPLDRAAGGQNAWVTNLDTIYNNSELSYLVSPCLDFSSLDEDPILSFSLFFQTESCCDEGWVEVSIDGGETWEKVGTAGTGINWYNDEINQWWDGSGGFSGWTIAANTLRGTAGESDVRVRFVFSTDFSITEVGMGIDNIFISIPLGKDLASVSVEHTSDEQCGSASDQVVLTFRNLGTETQTGFDVGYQIDNGPVVLENVGLLSVGAGEQFTYTFATPFNSLNRNVYTLRAWVSIAGDEFIVNDTATVTYRNFITPPFVEDFERGVLPQGWETDEAVPVSSAHNAPSFVLTDNLSSIDSEFTVLTPIIGPIEIGDSLTFDYRFVSFASIGEEGEELNAGDSLLVEITADCGESYVTVLVIDSLNHTTSAALQNRVVYLDDYAGQNIRIRFRAVWGEGDYFVDIDNVNIIRCPQSLQLTTTSQSATNANSNDGRAGVEAGAGLAPFSYRWSTGDSTKVILNLSPGVYSVTVIDAAGCTDVAEVIINNATSTKDIETLNLLQLAPNPTSGQAELQLEFNRVETVEVRIFSPVGQLLLQGTEQRGQRLTYPIDLSNYPAGMYFVQIRVGDKMRVEKLMLMKP